MKKCTAKEKKVFYETITRFIDSINRDMWDRKNKIDKVKEEIERNPSQLYTGTKFIEEESSIISSLESLIDKLNELEC